ncbi:hypothetical protein GC56T2_2956 [Geobacillus sp. C56-T2]|nr:hypothetical protein GC56T2_2956 [Geobacillus sp. C56-T2]
MEMGERLKDDPDATGLFDWRKGLDKRLVLLNHQPPRAKIFVAKQPAVFYNVYYKNTNVYCG